jgi:hypothetical protein
VQPHVEQHEPFKLTHKGMTMSLLLAATAIFIGACLWMKSDNTSTQLEINELISLIEQFEQEKALMTNLQKKQGRQYP